MKQRGFTLLETLAALVILALVCTLLLRGFSASRQMLSHASVSQRLSQVARSVMAEQRPEPLSVGIRRGHWNQSVSWVLKVAVAEQQRGVQLLKLDLTVREGRFRQHFSTLDVVSTGAVQ